MVETYRYSSKIMNMLKKLQPKNYRGRKNHLWSELSSNLAPGLAGAVIGRLQSMKKMKQSSSSETRKT